MQIRVPVCKLIHVSKVIRKAWVVLEALDPGERVMFEGDGIVYVLTC